MYRVFLLLTFILLISCGAKNESSSVKVSVSAINAAGINMPGGMLLYAHNNTTDKDISITFEENQDTIILNNGLWDFFVIGWAGPNNMEGTVECGGTSAELTGVDAVVDINVSNEKCLTPGEIESKFISSNQFLNLTMNACGSIPTNPTTGADCSGDVGLGQSFKLKLYTRSEDELGNEIKRSISSVCYDLSTGNATAPILLPFGGAEYSHFETELEFFEDSSCSTLSESFNFSDGIANSGSVVANNTSSEVDLITDGSSLSIFVSIDSDPVSNNMATLTAWNNIESIFTLNYADANSDLATGCSVNVLVNLTESTPCTCDAGGVCTVGVTPTSAGTSTFDFSVDTGSQTSNIATATIDAKAPFISRWRTTTANESITLPLRTGFNYNFTVDWGDGSAISTITSDSDPDITHTYATAGDYTVTMIGTIEAWYFNNAGDRLKLLEVNDLGNVGWTNLEGAFFGCTALETFAGGVTTNVTSMRQMFQSTPTMTNLDVSTFDTSSVIDMSGMFRGTSSLITLDLSNFNTSSVTTMSDMFNGTGLSSLDLTSFNTSNVTSMVSMFMTTPNLVTIDMSSFLTPALSNIGAMFMGATSLLSVDFSNFDTSSVTYMADLFKNATSLASINLTGLDTSAVTTMQNMFSNTPSLTSVDLSSFNTSSVTTMAFMFSNSAISSLDFTSWNVNAVTNMTSMFDGVSLDMTSYSQFLNMASSTSAQTNVTLSGGSSMYDTTAVNSRMNLESNGWTITDGGGPIPSVTAVDVSSGPVAGGTTIIITGADFIAGASVDIGDYTCNAVTVLSDTQLTCTTGAGVAGTYDIKVTNIDGYMGMLPASFTYSP